MAYSAEQLRTLFQHKFNLNDWTQFLINYLGAQTIRQVPEQLELDPSEGKGFYLGQKSTIDNYEIGLFYVQTNTSVVKRRVGLRQIVKPYLRYLVDAALVVFDDGRNWRLSFVCDIKDESTAPKRYTFVFGENDNYYNTAVSRFLKLQADGVSFLTTKDAFSVEALTKEFYNELFGWYQWAVSEGSGIYFPNDTNTDADDFEDNDKKIIRLLTRLMFIWFIKQKELVPDKLFDERFLKTILKDFEPESRNQGVYYNAILQNLFFATLNRAIEDEDGKRDFARLKGQRDIKTLYRYAEMFKISETAVINLFAEVPFLNGGLFECLDKTEKIDGKEFYFDGFSRNDSKWANGRYRHRAFIPNQYFFDTQRGLINILKRYNFTIEENTPNEQQVALDPELLGKVFENLLGAYNPETKETARNQSGSFYTPREIVNYMVDESLKAYLTNDTAISVGDVDNLLSDSFEYDRNKYTQYQLIAKRLRKIKILDPACGSGAFPMGLLNRMVDVLMKIDGNQDIYELKLNIIENCIYGSDIQNIATQISKLRFFISLICDCEKDTAKPNFGIPTLPNLETKFVTADSLLNLKKKKVKEQLDLFADNKDSSINIKKHELLDIRRTHFRAKTARQKKNLQKQDEALRNELLELIRENELFAPDDAKQLAKWNPYDQNGKADFFDAEWMFNMSEGFDIVIGNPPYIQLQNNGGELAKKYEGCEYKTFARTGDIYCLFYERGWQLLKKGGHLCFITSNKWMRAGYGEKTREFFAAKTNPQLLIDFAGVKIFESATVDTNILLFSKSDNRHETVCAVTNKQNKDSVKNLSDFVQQQNSVCDFSTSDSWVILSPIEQSIKRKIEAVGTPLKDWDINIYRGVLTGCNEAFIIDSEKRSEILTNCQTEDERKRTDELIRPILRGRDIKRYGYVDNGLYLINTHNGIRGRLPRIKIEDYPAVKAHLDQYWDRIATRADKGDTPYNLRNCAYLEDFSKPKVVYMEIQTDNPEEGYPFPCYSYDDRMCVVLNTAYIMSSETIDPRYVLGILNSRLGKFLVKLYVTQLQERQFRMLSQYVMKFPIALPSKEQEMEMTRLVQDVLVHQSRASENRIDELAFQIYRLTEADVNFLTNN